MPTTFITTTIDLSRSKRKEGTKDRAKNGNAKELAPIQLSDGKAISAGKAAAITLPEGTVKSENYNADENLYESSEHVKIKFDFKKAIDLAGSVESSSEDEGYRESELPPTKPSEREARQRTVCHLQQMN